jgi:PAS domain S-box-containing protein
MSQIGAPLVGSYDLRLVVLSILIAISASYAALDLGGRVTAARGWIRSGWLTGGATGIGFGIWSMHFTGMLAFNLPVPVAYHWPTVLLSLLAAILASAVVLFVATRQKMGPIQALASSVTMGAGIAGMHFIGMAAMRLPATPHYSLLKVGLAVVVGILASLVSLVLTFDFREETRGATWAKATSGAAMGVAISAMHYTGMASASFIASATPPVLSHTVSISSLGVTGIVLGALMVQGAATVTSSVDRRFAAQAQELQTSERFRQIADILGDVLALSPADLSQVLFVNRAYEKIWGRTAESLYADPRSWLEGVHLDDRQHVQEAVQKLPDGEPLDHLECRVVRPDGSISWVRLQAYPVADVQGHPYRIVATAHEFTKRKLAEEQLKRGETYLTMAQEMAQMGVWSWNPSSDDMFGSNEFYRIFGLDPAKTKLTRDVFLQSIHPEDRSRYELEINAAVTERRNWELDYRMLLSDGSSKYIQGIGRPIFSKSGEILEFVGTAVDITDRKLAEKELRRLSGQLLRLQDEERRKIARDLHDSTGQDLVALATMIGQVRGSIPSGERKSRRLLSECKVLADRCIREVRTLSYVLHPPVLDEAGLVEALRHFTAGFAERTGIEVDLEVAPDFGRLASDTELGLFRVVQESLTNIQRHSGSFTARIRVDRDTEKITLEVSDTGRGIYASKRTQNKTVPPTVGVGIPSMQERVMQIGGRLDIDSNSQGTTVRVTIHLRGERR